MVAIERVLFIMFLLAGLAGCASMNKSECLNADWRMIGMEDGSQGRPVARIGQHRKACADYNVTPDLLAYEAGHAAGLEQYCTESNGFRLGRQGGSHQGVCPPGLEEGFLAGYDAGKRIHVAGMAARQADSAVKSNHARLEKLKQEIKEKEALLVSSKTTEIDRIQLLAEIREDEKEVEAVAAKLPELESDRQAKHAEYEELMQAHEY